jgi:hypothetical protein
MEVAGETFIPEVAEEEPGGKIISPRRPDEPQSNGRTIELAKD